MRRYLTIIIWFSFVLQSSATLSVGGWQEHLPYREAKRVIKVDSKIYCLASNNLFSYDREDGILETWGRTNGLSDIGISDIAYSETHKILIIAYENGNLDLVSNESILNLSDIKRKTITGSKRINKITIYNNRVFLSCAFGVVELNLEKREVKDTYFVGDNGTFVNVNDLTIVGDSAIYICADLYIKRADLNSNLLVDFNNWLKDFSISDGTITSIESFQENVFAIVQNSGFNDDVMFNLVNGTWQQWNQIPNVDFFDVTKDEDFLLVIARYAVHVFNTDMERIALYLRALPQAAIYDNEKLELWMGGARNGLLYYNESGTDAKDTIIPNGPFDILIYDMAHGEDHLWVGGGTPQVRFSRKGAYAYQDNFWRNFNDENVDALDSIYNISSIAVDPLNKNHVYGGTAGFGLLEFRDNQIVNVYDDNNTVIRGIENYNEVDNVRILALDVSNNGNVYFTVDFTDSPLYVKEPNGTITNLEISKQDLSASNEVFDLIVTENNLIWLAVKRTGLIVYNDNGTPNNTNDDEYRRITPVNQDGVILTDVQCIAEDLDGNIWVGTTEGPIVYFNTGLEIFDNSFNVIGVQPKLPLNNGDNLAEYLLSSDKINDIAIDGANRKWFATSTSGAFLVSEDGKDQLLNFKTDNSPLLSNQIFTLSINHKNGEVFFGTDQGIISYRGKSTGGSNGYENMYVFPNPIREDYTGEIIISGLVFETTIKITDISGNLVFETTSLGGQAIWDGNDLGGNRVHTGVYLVFASNEDGSQSHVTKLLFIH